MGLSPRDAVLAISRLNMGSPIFYQIGLLMAFESLTDTPHTQHQGLHRAIALEFARVAHHINALKNITICLELTAVSLLLEELYGLLKKPIEALDRIHEEGKLKANPVTLIETNDGIYDGITLAEEIASIMSHDDKLYQALSKKWPINIAMASSLGLTGPFLRANRVQYDLRQNEGLREMYGVAPTTSLTDGGDAWARFILRPLDINASLRWLRLALHRFEKGATQIDPIAIAEIDSIPKKLFAFGEVEGPEGDVKIGLFVAASHNSHAVRIRTPAYFIGQAIPHLFSKVSVSEIPLLLYSLGITPQEIDQ